VFAPPPQFGKLPLPNWGKIPKYGHKYPKSALLTKRGKMEILEKRPQFSPLKKPFPKEALKSNLGKKMESSPNREPWLNPLI